MLVEGAVLIDEQKSHQGSKILCYMLSYVINMLAGISLYWGDALFVGRFSIPDMRVLG